MQHSCNTTCLSSAAAPSRCLMMSLVSRSVGPVKILGTIIITSSPTQVLPSMKLLDCPTDNFKIYESNRHSESFHYELQPHSRAVLTHCHDPKVSNLLPSAAF